LNNFFQISLVILISGISAFFQLGSPISSEAKSDNTNAINSNYWSTTLSDSIGIPTDALNLAFKGYVRLKQQNSLKNDSLIAIIDFSKPSVEDRFFIINLRSKQVIKKTLVAHGKNSGVLNAESFSNTVHSNQSSLGLFITQNTYTGKHGYSLRLNGVDKGINDNAFKRAVVIHGADYVSDYFIQKHQRLGRSFGCPALPVDETKEIIDLIKDGTCLFIYHPTLSAISQANPGT
jgi:hypothetical protein